MDFIAIDFETGMYDRNSAISVGAVKFSGGKQIDSFYSLIRPPVLYIRPDFTDIHGLVTSDVEGAPLFCDVWNNGLKTFLQNLPLVAHNAGFDMSVLRATLEHYDIEVPRYKYFDTLAISRKIWQHFERHSLTSLAEHFGITYDAHNALADAQTCARIVMLQAEFLIEQKKLLQQDAEKMSVLPFLKAANVKFNTLKD